MGLLTNVEGREKIIQLLLNHKIKICILSYVVGVIWMTSLAHHEIAGRNYFSENQLLPGLVDTYFAQSYHAGRMYTKLQQNCHSDNDTKDIVFSQLEELGLDVHSQHYKFESNGVAGSNIYAIYKSPRAAGVESIFLNVPLRANCSSSGGLALALALAKFFRQQTYWAKDIIFLITDNDEYGMKAWLEAYYNEHTDDLKADMLAAHAGSIQAGLVLDMARDHVTHFDLLYTGLNGQLPNLDVINLLFRIARYEGVPLKFKHQRNVGTPNTNFLENLQNLLRMMVSHSTGYPSSNHGMFYKYRIEAVTLRGEHDRSVADVNYHIGFENLGRVVEGTFRSLNNMLEHFHQSFFLYVLPHSNRYISIGLYMPALAGVLLPLALSLLAWWVRIFNLHQPTLKTNVVYSNVVVSSIITSYLISLACYYITPYLINSSLDATDEMFFLATFLPGLGMLLLSFLFASQKKGVDDFILCFIAALYLVLSIAVVSLLNFSLSFFVALFYVPLFIVADVNNRLINTFKPILRLLTYPPMFVFFVCMLHESLAKSRPDYVDELALKTIATWRSALTYDQSQLTLGVWTRKVVYFVLTPLWLLQLIA